MGITAIAVGDVVAAMARDDQKVSRVIRYTKRFKIDSKWSIKQRKKPTKKFWPYHIKIVLELEIQDKIVKISVLTFVFLNHTTIKTYERLYSLLAQ